MFCSCLSKIINAANSKEDNEMTITKGRTTIHLKVETEEKEPQQKARFNIEIRRSNIFAHENFIKNTPSLTRDYWRMILFIYLSLYWIHCEHIPLLVIKPKFLRHDKK